MPYQFAGFFARPAVPKPADPPPDAVWRDVASPFVGVGVLLPEWIGRTPAPGRVRALARRLGLDAAEGWLDLTYSCWGGDVDFVYGLGVRAGEAFGPIEVKEIGRAEAAYLDLMGRFGISAEDALRFEPFTRGYWGVHRDMG
ncbi:hypothetical protein [Paludisphaera soli]|uniref:hypothetical protein n=1 Tax=Paludisphaera soli TaxID=2712865 RepID=UPI0013EE355B|nr:hypothetical protein [Paludisphaera soli]